MVVVRRAEGTSAPGPSARPSLPLNAQNATLWLVGLGGVWIILTLMAEFDDTREVAVALAVLILGTALLVHGVPALQNLGVAT